MWATVALLYILLSLWSAKKFQVTARDLKSLQARSRASQGSAEYERLSLIGCFRLHRAYKWKFFAFVDCCIFNVRSHFPEVLETFIFALASG